MEQQLKKRQDDLSKGFAAYQAARRPAPRTRRWAQNPVWQLGSTRLLYHPPAARSAKAPVFLLPSLVNRWHVLDLLPNHSLVEWLAAHGHGVYVLDWDAPSEEEQGFGVAEYVQRRVIPALQKTYILENQHIHLFGYCMGGVLALAAAQEQQAWLKSLILLATPWDFSSPTYQRAAMPEHLRPQLAAWIENQPTFPAQWLDAMFYMASPWAVHAKYRQFPRMKAGTDARKIFIAVEDWVHEGVPLASKVARECIVDWGMENALMSGEFALRGRAISPEKITLPTLLFAPRKDMVVPESSALALEKLLPEAYVEKPNSGHVSLLVGPQRKSQLYAPLEDWLQFTA